MKVLNVLNTLSLKQIFWKGRVFLKKLEYCFLVESTQIENTSFPYKTTISEANVKANRMVSTKWTYHKERNFVSNYFTHLKILFQFKNLDLIYQRPECLYSFFSYSFFLEFYLTVLFPCEYP